MLKTNAIRLLQQAGINFEVREYKVDEEHLAGIYVAQETGLPVEQVFKTLVAHGEKRGYLVFCIPVAEELDLKKAAQAVGDKKIEMVHVKDLLGLTGYIRGGCSPVGMKKKFPTYFDETALLWDKIAVSAGVRGGQVFADRAQLIAYIGAQCVDLTQNV